MAIEEETVHRVSIVANLLAIEYRIGEGVGGGFAFLERLQDARSRRVVGEAAIRIHRHSRAIGAEGVVIDHRKRIVDVDVVHQDTFARGDIPFTAVLLIDASASMYGEKIESAIAGAAFFVHGMQGLDQAQVMVFSDQLLSTTPITDAKAILTAGLS